MHLKESIESEYVAKLLKDNAIAKATFNLLQVRMEISGDRAVLTEKETMEFIKVLGQHLVSSDEADRIAAERLIRQEYKYACQFIERWEGRRGEVRLAAKQVLHKIYHTSSLIHKLETEITILDL